MPTQGPSSAMRTYNTETKLEVICELGGGGGGGVNKYSNTLNNLPNSEEQNPS